MPRITRIAGSFAIVVIAYWAYALLAVRWIEPPADLRSDGEISNSERQRAAKLVDARLKEFEGLFAPQAWELTNPKILESDRAKLLFQTYENFPDGRVELRPCTIVFRPDDRGDEEQCRRRSIILEAPAGAVLQFDQPLDLNRAKIGRLVRGQLRNKVTIRSDCEKPGPEDDLRIETQDIQLTEQTISTPNPVDFRWGPHCGRGHDMVIKLLAGPPQPGMEGNGPNITGIESFELRHVERLHLDMGQAMTAPGQKPASVPVEIHCCGPFRFDVAGRVATFRDRVDVMKLNPSGPSDQIVCELLSLYFRQRSKEKPDPRTAASLDLEPERIEARGNPAVVTAPSQKEAGGVVVARAERFQYDLLANSIALDGGQEVFLQRGPNEIHARSLYYQSAGPGRMGRMAAQGPGWLRGQPDDRPNQQLEALWKDQLRVDPDQQKQLISLSGGAELKFPGAGQIQAREIFLWLAEGPPTPNKQPAQPRPERMLARGDVHMNSPQLSGKMEQLEVKFEQKAEDGRGKAEETMGARRNDSQPVAASAAGPAMGGSPPLVLVRQPSPVGTPAQPPPQQPAPQRFEVVGRVLRAHLLLGDQQPALSALTIEDGVRLCETQTAQPGERPLTICGDRLEGTDMSGPNAAVTIVGKPARFEGRGLRLTGSNINLNRGTNRLWIDGAGQMEAPLDGGLQGQAPVGNGALTVGWQSGMDFDGRTARFQQGVVAATGQQLLRTESMQVQLQQPIRFAEASGQPPAKVETIQCHGGVTMEQRTFDGQQQLATHDRMEVTDLAVNILSGALTAGGPGWINSVQRGSANPLGGMPVAAARNAPVGPAPARDQLNCLHVQFQKSITGSAPLGNVLHRLTFADQVQMAYAPVDNWDAVLTTSDPDKLGPQGVAVRCDQLTVVQMPHPTGDRQPFELEALGNTVVEGTTFTARGNRITYDEAKDLLILEGDGRNSADLFRQLQPGAATDHQAAQRILYWPKTKRLSVVGARSLELSQPPTGNRMQ
jgi:lipopolysaccharide export system protein LptA